MLTILFIKYCGINVILRFSYPLLIKLTLSFYSLFKTSLHPSHPALASYSSAMTLSPSSWRTLKLMSEHHIHISHGRQYGDDSDFQHYWVLSFSVLPLLMIVLFPNFYIFVETYAWGSLQKQGPPSLQTIWHAQNFICPP